MRAIACAIMFVGWMIGTSGTPASLSSLGAWVEFSGLSFWFTSAIWFIYLRPDLPAK